MRLQGCSELRELAKPLDEVDRLQVTTCLDVQGTPSNTSIEILVIEGFARDLARLRQLSVKKAIGH